MYPEINFIIRLLVFWYVYSQV